MSDKLNDVRLIKHHIRRQVLDPNQVQARLDELEDSAEHGEETETRFQSHGDRKQPVAE